MVAMKVQPSVLTSPQQWHHLSSQLRLQPRTPPQSRSVWQCSKSRKLPNAQCKSKAICAAEQQIQVWQGYNRCTYLKLAQVHQKSMTVINSPQYNIEWSHWQQIAITIMHVQQFKMCVTISFWRTCHEANKLHPMGLMKPNGMQESDAIRLQECL